MTFVIILQLAMIYLQRYQKPIVCKRTISAKAAACPSTVLKCREQRKTGPEAPNTVCIAMPRASSLTLI